MIERLKGFAAPDAPVSVIKWPLPTSEGDDGATSAQPVAFKSLRAFVSEYVPLSYVIEPIIRDGSLYTLTARTGAGKTALLVVMALAVATGRRDLLSLDVVKGRVAFLTAENPDDLRMRFMIACYLLNIDDEVLDRIEILDRREKPEDICAALAKLADQEPFSQVILDTLAAFYDGVNVNDPIEGGEFLRRLRPITRIKGRPAVVVAAHPVKNASADNLLPYGSGAILNEVDGNLTLWKSPETGFVSFYWQGKLRGLEFEPLLFRFEITGSPDVLDVKERQVQLPTLLPIKEQDAEQRESAEANADRALLRAMIDAPSGTQQEWAKAIRRAKSGVNRKLQKLSKAKLVSETLGKWSVTQQGRKALELGGTK